VVHPGEAPTRMFPIHHALRKTALEEAVAAGRSVAKTGI
jgi:hypothetical protein